MKEKNKILVPEFTVKELWPASEDSKGFNCKAYEVHDHKNRAHFLLSYDTIVMGIDSVGKVYRYWDGWSATTGRHISAFTYWHLDRKMTKQEFLALPVTEY